MSEEVASLGLVEVALPEEPVVAVLLREPIVAAGVSSTAKTLGITAVHVPPDGLSELAEEGRVHHAVIQLDSPAEAALLLGTPMERVVCYVANNDRELTAVLAGMPLVCAILTRGMSLADYRIALASLWSNLKTLPTELWRAGRRPLDFESAGMSALGLLAKGVPLAHLPDAIGYSDRHTRRLLADCCALLGASSLYQAVALYTACEITAPSVGGVVSGVTTN